MPIVEQISLARQENSDWNKQGANNPETVLIGWLRTAREIATPVRRGVYERNPAKLPRILFAKHRMKYRTCD